MQSDMSLSAFASYLARAESTPVRVVGGEEMWIGIHQLTQQPNARRPRKILAWRNFGEHLPLPLSLQSSLLDRLRMSLGIIQHLTSGVTTMWNARVVLMCVSSWRRKISR